ncbi:unnamed protein product [Caretta caretta]
MGLHVPICEQNLAWAQKARRVAVQDFLCCQCVSALTDLKAKMQKHRERTGIQKKMHKERREGDKTYHLIECAWNPLAILKIHISHSEGGHVVGSVSKLHVVTHHVRCYLYHTPTHHLQGKGHQANLTQAERVSFGNVLMLKGMKNRGHNRDLKQCRVKLKELRQAYQKTREANGCSGLGQPWVEHVIWINRGMKPPRDQTLPRSCQFTCFLSGLNGV